LMSLSWPSEVALHGRSPTQINSQLLFNYPPSGSVELYSC